MASITVLKSSSREFQLLGVKYLVDLRPYLVVLRLAKVVKYVHLAVNI